jgi:hypothetical protein
MFGLHSTSYGGIVEGQKAFFLPTALSQKADSKPQVNEFFPKKRALAQQAQICTFTT